MGILEAGETPQGDLPAESRVVMGVVQEGHLMGVGEWEGWVYAEDTERISHFWKKWCVPW